jgi:hypothetical protein
VFLLLHFLAEIDLFTLTLFLSRRLFLWWWWCIIIIVILADAHVANGQWQGLLSPIAPVCTDSAHARVAQFFGVFATKNSTKTDTATTTAYATTTTATAEWY